MELSYNDSIKKVLNLVRKDTGEPVPQIVNLKLDKVYSDYVRPTHGCSVKALKEAIITTFSSIGLYLTDDCVTNMSYVLLDSDPF